MKTLLIDVEHMLKARHHSGLVRVSERLMHALEQKGAVDLVPVRWHVRKACLLDTKGKVVKVSADMSFLQVPPVSPDERPGMLEYLGEAGVKRMAVYHDAIPMKHPSITWPKSVARHPGYMKSLADYEQVFAVSDASLDELKGYWAWLGIRPRAQVSRIPLGADFCEAGQPFSTDRAIKDILMVGILEPRKNQELLLDVWDALARSRADCPTLHLVGRVNPHFGKDLLKRVQRMQKRGGKVLYHEGLDDAAMRALYERCALAVFPSIAEGCGLPVLEALWMGLPVLCSPLPSHRESAVFGGVKVLPDWDPESWVSALDALMESPEQGNQVFGQVNQASLPRWAGSAEAIISALEAR